MKKIIGRVESISLPDLDLDNIDSKIDTGAYSCAIHCKIIEHTQEAVTFKLLDKSHPKYINKKITLPISKIKKVKSTIGSVQERIFIKTKLKIFNKSYLTEFSLADRTKMRYPVLIGRKFLNNRFIVDVTKSYTE